MRNQTALLFSLGRPFSPIYSGVMKLRERMYNAQILKRHKLTVPVISIGNLVLGGTGKTPTVKHVAELLSIHGYHPAIISRGYGGKAKQDVNIVSDTTKVLLSPVEAGDEPSMLAELLPGIPVITGARRIHPCNFAIKKYKVDVIILDDGFQHLSVERDIDTVLFDATTLAGNSRVFPGGILREPVSALLRCNAFLLTGVTDKNRVRAQGFSDLLQQRFPEKPVFFSTSDALKLWQPDNKSEADFSAKNYFAFCGIANPSRFKESLGGFGIDPCDFVPLDDHAVYTQALISNLCKKAITSGAESLVTTEKDYVKIKDLEIDLPLRVLKVRPKIDQSFDDFILSCLEKRLHQTDS